MSLHGNLQDVALPDILQLLASQGKSGVLTLSRGREVVRIGISDGLAAHADSNQRSLYQRLGRMLVNAGKISREGLKRALVIHKATGRKLGQVLVAEGMAAREDVRRALSLQFLQIIYAVLRWDEGAYHFERGDVDFDREHSQPVSFQGILMDGMRMIDEWPSIERSLANRNAILHRVPADGAGDGAGDGAALEPGSLVARVYERIDGRLTIQQVIDRSMELEFDVCRALHDLLEKKRIGPAYDGRLDEVGFPELMLALRRTRSTGQLTLRRAQTVKTVSLRDGNILSATSSDPDDGIGPYLLSRDVIARCDLDAATAEAAGADEVGECLVRSGLLDKEWFDSHLGGGMAEIVLSLFAWSDGNYQYRPGLKSLTSGVDLTRRTPALLLRGILTINRWSRIARAVGPRDTVYRLREDVPAEVLDELSDDQRRILGLFAGGLSVGDACERAGVAQFFLHQLIWAGCALGALEGPDLESGTRLLMAALRGELAEPPTGMPDEPDEPDDATQAETPRVEPVPLARVEPARAAMDDGIAAIAREMAARSAFYMQFEPPPAPLPEVPLEQTGVAERAGAAPAAPAAALDAGGVAAPAPESTTQSTSPPAPTPVPPPPTVPLGRSATPVQMPPPVHAARARKPEPSGVHG